MGESGSGKSVSSLTVMGLTRFFKSAQISGSIKFDGQELLTASDEEMRRIRGNEIAMIFQDPLSSLHPFYRIGKQLVEAIQSHRNVSQAQARDRAVEMLGLVGIPEPRKRVDAYPHEFSGGMRQRVMIAMALCNDPKLLIADEPTTALDVTVQAQILELIQRLQPELDTAIVMITHDLGVVAEVADEIAVMYAGRIVEHAPKETIFARPSTRTRGACCVDPAPGPAARRGARADLGPPAVAHQRCPAAARSTRAARTCARRTPRSTPTWSRSRTTPSTWSAACWRPTRARRCGPSCRSGEDPAEALAGRRPRRPRRARRDSTSGARAAHRGP